MTGSGSLGSRVGQSFNALVESGSIRYTTLPVAAAPTALVSDGIVAAWAWAPYVEVVVAAVAPNPCWLCGIAIHTGAVETFNGDIAVAIGAAAAEVDIAMFHIVSGIPTAVGVSVAGPMFLPYPIKVMGSPRFAVRLRKSTGASAAGCSVKLIVAASVGN